MLQQKGATTNLFTHLEQKQENKERQKSKAIMQNYFGARSTNPTYCCALLCSYILHGYITKSPMHRLKKQS